MTLLLTAQTASSPRISTIGTRILMRPRCTPREYSVLVRGSRKRIPLRGFFLGATLSSRNRDEIDSDGYDGTRADAVGTAADWSVDTDCPRLYTSPTNAAYKRDFVPATCV